MQFPLNNIGNISTWEDGKTYTGKLIDENSSVVAKKLKEICNQHLRTVVNEMGITRVIGVGRYAQKQAAAIFSEIDVDWVPHPSPASPFANRNGGADWRTAFSDVLGI